MQKQLMIGAFEYVDIPEFGGKDILAKIDTGAFSGAIHCTDIKLIKRGALKRKILKFTPFGEEKLARETTDFKKSHVRVASGHRQRRFIIETDIYLKGERFRVSIGLSDRSDMKYEILLGRKFLKENNMLVDLARNHELDEEWEQEA